MDMLKKNPQAIIFFYVLLSQAAQLASDSRATNYGRSIHQEESGAVCPDFSWFSHHMEGIRTLLDGSEKP